jgi:hypothetical protein
MEDLRGRVMIGDWGDEEYCENRSGGAIPGMECVIGGWGDDAATAAPNPGCSSTTTATDDWLRRAVGQGLREGVRRMVVIARIPRLDPPAGTDVVVARGATAVAVGGWKPEPAGELAASAMPSAVAIAANVTGGKRRRDGTPFPMVSTVVLAIMAGACWTAVWRQERQLASETDAAEAADDVMTARSESAGDAGGSVTR